MRSSNKCFIDSQRTVAKRVRPADARLQGDTRGCYGRELPLSDLGAQAEFGPRRAYRMASSQTCVLLIASRHLDTGFGCAFTVLYDLTELVQRAQIIRPWLVSESLRPVGPRHLADIEVAVAVYRKPMRRQELGWTKARAKPA